MSFGIPVRNGLGVGLLASTFLSSLRIGGRPAMFLDFIGTNSLDSSVTFTRASTATVTNSSGVIQSSAINDPRFDYNPVTLAPKGLLIEEQRTNLLLYSQQIDNATWTKLRATVTANSTTSPDGTSNADTLLDTAVAGTHIAIQLITKAASALTYATTIYLKKDVRDQGEFRMSDQAGNGVRCTFNLTTGVVGTAAAFGVGFVAGSSQITNAGNGWYRLTLIGTTNAVVTLGSEVYIADASGNLSYTGTGAGFFVWGAQLEQATFATSYIPTVAATVIRSADSASMTGTNFTRWYNQTAGTLVVNASQPTIFASSRTAASLNYTVTGSRVNIYRQSAGGIYGFITPGVGALVSGLNATANTPWKAAIAYDATTGYFSANGSTVVTGVNSATLSLFDNLCIGNSSPAASEHFNGYIRTIAYYNTRLPNTTLQVLSA